MRLPAVLTAGVTSTAAVLLLSGCGGDSGSDAADSASDASSETSSASGEEGVQAFCDEAQTVFTGLDDAFTNATDPAQLPGLLQQATSALQGIDPPAEIEAPWTSFSDALAQLSESAQSLDLRTTEGQDQFTQQYNTLLSTTTDAQQDVDQFVTANCPGAAGESGSPTS